MKHILLFFAVFVFFTGQLSSQPRTVKGVVTTLENVAVVGAEVKVKSSKEVVYTDDSGLFEVVLTGKDKLKISAHGFLKRNVKVDENIRAVMVNLPFKSDPESLLLAVGYGHIKDEDKPFALSTLKENEVDFSMYKDIYELISGKFAGVEVSNGQIFIRGQRSINYSNAALIVIDGTIADAGMLATLNTKDIISIDIIKDGSSSIYGSRGANGVVMIQTNMGFVNP